MVALWLCRKLGVSRCPVWHNKAKPKSVAHRSDHKPGEVPEAYTVEVDKKMSLGESWDWQIMPRRPLIGRTDDAHIN